MNYSKPKFLATIGESFVFLKTNFDKLKLFLAITVVVNLLSTISKNILLVDLIFLAIVFYIALSLIRMIVDIEYQREQATIYYFETSKRFIKPMFLTLLKFVAVIAVIVILWIILVMNVSMTLFDSGVSTYFWAIVLLSLLVLFFILTVFANQQICQTGETFSFKRNIEFIKGYFWRLLGVNILLALLAVLISAIFYMIIAMTGIIDFETIKNYFINNTFNTRPIILKLFESILSSLSSFFISIYYTKLYIAIHRYKYKEEIFKSSSEEMMSF